MCPGEGHVPSVLRPHFRATAKQGPGQGQRRKHRHGNDGVVGVVGRAWHEDDEGRDVHRGVEREKVSGTISDGFVER